MTRSKDPSGRQHHGLPVDDDEHPSTPYKSLGQTLTGKQQVELRRAIQMMMLDQWKAKKKKEEDEEAKAAQGGGSKDAPKITAGTWLDEMEGD
ncbi:unnamed protein product [Sordaria macrospora k-hell]|uniref:WGS project CABT00000000 data, contig 2.22 n=1 Tax=Sordaria macrospora (strain ATCC MYA-333 / DSM 997 / K(L3346) / K-hell) TaxID=771870 RepID=F7W2P4_SORMK|nr:uncharacterized protein SMAC_05107 [Sordaria macrospora k-hell]KAH7632514.1 hypothetical protein B0T09DRAFT_394580 [Sordaria sp. MPI-SDFR-AT-0083]CCC11895.1 unnamed protein product [Sordaria macrospora k-hell]